MTTTQPTPRPAPLFVGVKIAPQKLVTLKQLTGADKSATALKIAANYYINQHQAPAAVTVPGSEPEEVQP